MWRGRAGFTMLELSIVAAILVAVAGVLGIVLIRSGELVWVRTDLQLTAMTDAQRAMDRLRDDLRIAARSSLASCSETVGLSFQIRNPDGSLTPVITYTRTGTRLFRTRFGEPAQVVADNVVTFTPVCEPGGVVSLQVAARPPTSRTSIGFVQTLSSKVLVKNT